MGCLLHSGAPKFVLKISSLMCRRCFVGDLISAAPSSCATIPTGWTGPGSNGHLRTLQALALPVELPAHLLPLEGRAKSAETGLAATKSPTNGDSSARKALDRLFQSHGHLGITHDEMRSHLVKRGFNVGKNYTYNYVSGHKEKLEQKGGKYYAKNTTKSGEEA